MAQGEDLFPAVFRFTARAELSKPPYQIDTLHDSRVDISWDSIFASVAPSMLNEASDETLKERLRACFNNEAQSQVAGDKSLEDKKLLKFVFSSRQIETCIIQLRALGLIIQSDKKRSLKDAGTYWTLTPYGNRRMVQLRAIKRGEEALEEEEDDSSESE